MSGLGDPSGTRLVCLVDDDHAELGRLASRLRVMGWTSSAAWLENIAGRYADAPADPAEAFANGAMADAHFRPHGHIIAAGLKALGYDASQELCATCSGTGWLDMPLIDGVFHPNPPCDDCKHTGLAALGVPANPANEEHE